MLRKILVVFVALTASVWLVAGRETKDPVSNQIDSIVGSLSEITGLPEKHAVPYGRMSKEQLRQFLTKRIKKTLKPQELYADELSLKMFGLVPQDYDLRQATVSLLTEQAAAFYDYDKKKLFLLQGSSSISETTTLAHELSHALADQHFNLERFIQDTPSNDDENLAHTAVVEGQASWLMIAYDLKQAGKPPLPTQQMLNAVADASNESMADYPVLKGSPLYIQQSLLFPYSAGILFFDAVYKRMGKEAFGVVFKNAPTDSAEIIHPERYFAHEKSSKPSLPKLSLRDERKEIAEGSVGEFDLAMMLRQYLNEKESAALSPHLRGGRFKILSVEEKHKPVLEYVSEWDSEERAVNFFTSYQKILQRKWKRCDVSSANDKIFGGRGDNGYFVLSITGRTVMSVEGVVDQQDWQRLSGVQQTTSIRNATER